MRRQYGGCIPCRRQGLFVRRRSARSARQSRWQEHLPIARLALAPPDRNGPWLGRPNRGLSGENREQQSCDPVSNGGPGDLCRLRRPLCPVNIHIGGEYGMDRLQTDFENAWRASCKAIEGIALLL